MPAEILLEEDSSLWDDYVQKHPNGTLYHKIAWKKIVENSFGHSTYYLISKDSGKVNGVLPLVSLKSKIFGNILCSMPFLNFGGILSDDENSCNALIESSRKIALELDTDFIELRHQNQVNEKFVSNTHKVSMTIGLNKDPEVLWNNFSSKHRNELRKSLKSDLTIKFGKEELLDEYYTLISRGWRDLGTPIYAKSFFKNILEHLNKNIELVLVYHKYKPIAAAYNGLFKDTIEGMWTYSLPEYRRLRTNYFLYWKMIERACEQGFETYHLGRSSKDTGAVMFKKKWKAEPHQLYWDYLLFKNNKMPEINVNNPKYKLMISTWQKLPVWLTQIIGPQFAKYIP